jgi:hypothetical protein
VSFRWADGATPICLFSFSFKEPTSGVNAAGSFPPEKEGTRETKCIRPLVPLTILDLSELFSSAHVEHLDKYTNKILSVLSKNNCLPINMVLHGNFTF